MTTQYIWFGSRAVRFESGGSTGPQIELIDENGDFATRTLPAGTYDFTGSEWQQLLAFNGTAEEMAALGIDLSNGVDIATAGMVTTTGDLRVGEGVEAQNIADIAGGGRVMDVSGSLDASDDPVAISGLGKASSAILAGVTIDGTGAGNRVVFSNDIGFGFIGGSGFDPGGNALRLNDGEAISFEIRQGKVLSEASFTVKVLGNASTHVVLDSDGATLRDENGAGAGGIVQDASAGELDLGELAHGAKVAINYVAQTIAIDGVAFAGDAAAFFAAFVTGGSKHLTLGSLLGNNTGWSADDLVLQTNESVIMNRPPVALASAVAGSAAGGAMGLFDAEDPEGGALTYELRALPAAGLVTLGAGGSFSFDPAGAFAALALGETQEVSFTYVVRDALGAESNEAEVTITIYGGAAAPVAGTAGADSVAGDATAQLLDLGAGNDTTDAGGGDDVVIFRPGEGNDVVEGGEGEDTLVVQQGPAALAITVTGTPAGIVLIEAADGSSVEVSAVEEIVIRGGGADDVVYVVGDLFAAGVAQETVHLLGGAGNDLLDASGMDGWPPVRAVIEGGEGNDTLKGGNGNDIYRGGAGADRIVFDAGSADYAIFRPGEINGDVLVEFAGPVPGSDAHRLIFVGYGTEAEGARLEAIGGGQWRVTSADGLQVDTFALQSSPGISYAGYAFLDAAEWTGERHPDTLSQFESVYASVASLDIAPLLGDAATEVGGTPLVLTWAESQTFGVVAELTVAGELLVSLDESIFVPLNEGDFYVAQVAIGVARAADDPLVRLNLVDVYFQGVNDAPVVADGIADQSVDEDTPWNFTFALEAFGDVDGDALFYEAYLANGDALPDWLTFDSGSRSFSGTPPADFNGTIGLMVVALDDGYLSVSETFDLMVQPAGG